MEKTTAIFEALEKTNTNFTVEKIPLMSICGKPTNVNGIFRSDNGEHLGTVKDRYECYQNYELLELLYDATKAIGLNITNGGFLNKGSKIYYQMELPSTFIGRSNVLRNLTALNSHDATMSIAFGSTSTVVVCQNTFHRAYQGLEKVKHTKNAKEKLDIMVENMNAAISYDNDLMDKFKIMCEHELNDEMINRISKTIFKVDLDSKLINSISTRKRNEMQKFANNLATEIQLEGKTLWGLFNAVTRYTNHEMNEKGTDKQMSSILYGSGAHISNLAFNDIMRYIEDNTIELIPVK